MAKNYRVANPLNQFNRKILPKTIMQEIINDLQDREITISAILRLSFLTNREKLLAIYLITSYHANYPSVGVHYLTPPFFIKKEIIDKLTKKEKRKITKVITRVHTKYKYIESNILNRFIRSLEEKHIIG